MPVSDSPWAPTGFGTNTKNIAAILSNQGHHIGYGGCQNNQHGMWYTPWPLGQTETEAKMELLPMIYPGQEKFGEKSFGPWCQKFKPDLTDKASKQDLKFSREAKSEAQFEVEQGYDLKIPKNIDRSLSSISSEIQKGNKNTAMKEIEQLMRELGDN